MDAMDELDANFHLDLQGKKKPNENNVQKNSTWKRTENTVHDLAQIYQNAVKLNKEGEGEMSSVSFEKQTNKKILQSEST